MIFIFTSCSSTHIAGTQGKENIEWLMVLIFLCMVFIVLFWLIWIEQNRKNKYITLQRELMQKRSDTFLTAGDEAEKSFPYV